MVKRSRSQSQLLPSFFSWLTMRLPYLVFHAQARSRKPSRPTISLVRPSARMASTTLASVAMEAWSVPGTHRAA